MKKQTRLIFIALCLLVILCVVAFASCKDDGMITVTVKLNLDGTETKTFETEADSAFYDKLADYLPADADGLTFVGWTDESGTEITSETRWNKDGAVCAVWKVSYTTEHYFETDIGFVKSDEHTTHGEGILGASVSAEPLQITGYVFDLSNQNNVQTLNLAVGATLKLYYKRAAVTVTFDKNLASAAGQMAALDCSYGVAHALTANAFTSEYEFGGWNTKPNGTGDFYADGANITVIENTTLYAQWKVSYVEQIYVEQFVNNEYTYVLTKTETCTGFLGNSVTIKSTYDGEHYFLDYDNAEGNLDEQSLAEGAALKAYYSLNRYTVTYTDDGTRVIVRYGQSYVIRDPEQATVASYCTSPTGDGREYEIGETIQITGDLTLYPVNIEIFTDADGSGDVLETRANYVGLGSATLVKQGVRYQGYLNVLSDGVITFDVTVDGTEIHGKLLSDGSFIYRNETEEGTYFYYDYLFPDGGVLSYIMLALDGYGTGVLSIPLDDGTERVANYYVNYAATEEDDYYMEYYLPANPEQVNSGYFDIVQYHFDGFDQIKGYFMLCGVEYGDHTLVYNGSVQSDTRLFINGYGMGMLYSIDADGEITQQVIGTYLASDEYTSDAPEYVFIPADETLQEQYMCYFILFSQQGTDGKTYTFFMIKRGEAGSYTQTAGQSYPELYLDGYGGAMYFSSENDQGSLGSYTIQTVSDGGFEVIITFVDNDGGTLRVILDKSNNTFTVNDNEFVIDENGVLTRYLGNSSVIVIPEGVKEIADNVFNSVSTGKSFTSVTLPSTIQTIGERAFQNENVLKTIYINAITPPTLGLNAFHWMRSDLLIIVPDGCEEAYRNAEGWADYANYVTSNAELSNKPEFEIKNGVLVSYNNKDSDPQKVQIVIPDEVTEIAAGVFASREYIVSVNLNNVTVIGDNAFDSCSNLASVTFNANTLSIGKEAFFGCSSLTEVDLFAVQTIGDGAFNCCFNLTKVHIGANISAIGTYAFAQCAIELDENETIVAQNDLIVTIDAVTPPVMSSKVFAGSVPRIYVASYDVGLTFVNTAEANWASYAVNLRVKSANQPAVYYSMENMGLTLVLGDRADYGEGSALGLYKWQGNMLHIAWFIRDEFTNILRVEEYTAPYDAASGEIRGIKYGQEILVFVTDGTQVTYTNDNETLTVTFGSGEAQFNGNPVQIEIVNYRMQFTYQDYLYKLTLNNNETFTYTVSKVKRVKSYSAADGSSVTVTYGDSITAVGTLKDVDGMEITVEFSYWYLSLVEGNTYTWIVQWRSSNYLVTATFDNDNLTFEYSVEQYLTRVTYRSGNDYVLVTNYADGRVSMIINFKTANGSLECNAENLTAVDGAANTYTFTVNQMIDEVNADGEVTGQIPSEFNGNYTIVLNTTDNTYVLTRN